MTPLEDLMRCPVDWAAQFGDEGWFWSLPFLDWYFCLAQHAVDGNDLPYYPHEYEEYYGNSDKLDRMLKNLTLRRGEAEKLYDTRARRLYGLRVMTPAEYGKYLAFGITMELAAERSKNGVSLFWENFSSARLEGAFWHWFSMYFDIVTNFDEYLEFLDTESEIYKTHEAQLWRRFLGEHQLRICMNTIQAVGASEGALTSFLCYDLHIDTKTAHCYPVSESEALRIMGDGGVLMNDGLNC